MTWLDVTAAKARFGMWLGGIMPTFVPWEDIFHRRSGAARRRQARADADGEGFEHAKNNDDEEVWTVHDLHADCLATCMHVMCMQSHVSAVFICASGM